MKFLGITLSLFILSFTTIFAENIKWQQSETANIQLAIRSKNISKTKSAKFIVTSNKGKKYTKNVTSPIEDWIKVYFPGDFNEFIVDAGKYKWVCVVDNKEIASGNFSFDNNMNLIIGNK